MLCSRCDSLVCIDDALICVVCKCFFHHYCVNKPASFCQDEKKDKFRCTTCEKIKNKPKIAKTTPTNAKTTTNATPLKNVTPLIKKTFFTKSLEDRVKELEYKVAEKEKKIRDLEERVDGLETTLNECLELN